MRIITKHIKVLGLTKTEMSQLQEMITEAAKGVTVNYSERRQPDGSYFGISVSDEHKYTPPEPHTVAPPRYSK